MSVVKVQLKIRNHDLSAALQQLGRVSDRLPSYLVNKSCNWIAIHAKEAMPVASPARIASEMAMTTAATEMKTGILAAARFRRTRSLTMAQKIVLARMHPNSKFNRDTGGVFALKPPPGSGGGPTPSRGRYKLGGQAKTRFWEWVDEHATRMVAARRKSSGFFKFGAEVIQFIFYGVVSGKAPVRPPSEFAGTTAEVQPYGGKVGQAIGRVAGGIPATDGQAVARARFWVSSTEPDTKGKGGLGFKSVAEPVWQRAVDKESALTRERAEQLYAQAARECGFKVT